MRKLFSPKQKALAAIEAVKGIKTINQIGSQYEAHPNQVGIWKKTLLERAPECTWPKTIDFGHPHYRKKNVNNARSPLLAQDAFIYDTAHAQVTVTTSGRYFYVWVPRKSPDRLDHRPHLKGRRRDVLKNSDLVGQAELVALGQMK